MQKVHFFFFFGSPANEPAVKSGHLDAARIRWTTKIQCGVRRVSEVGCALAVLASLKGRLKPVNKDKLLLFFCPQPRETAKTQPHQDACADTWLNIPQLYQTNVLRAE